MTAEVFMPLRWRRPVLELLDQLRLPNEEVWITCETADEVAHAIKTMQIRGAPAIGCAAAYGVALAALQNQSLDSAIDVLAASRPTAVNLFWALDEMKKIIAATDQARLAAALEERARAIHAEDVEMCRRIGAHGQMLIPDKAVVLTHCNAGALATGGYGTALGVLRAAREAGKAIHVFADETRPFLQGARLTAWELQRDGFDVTVIPDVAAPSMLRRGEINCVVVGADRIAKNGDVANKVGTYGVALAAHAAGVPFYVAAPTSTLDPKCPSGADIPIEERGAEEVLVIGNQSIAPKGVSARYPAFDVTPHELVTAIITDAGVHRPPYRF
jgi:methylthioribose-1-phosphate isomerase